MLNVVAIMGRLVADPELRPSPVDEAKWGFAVVENSLWQGVPNYLRELNEQLEEPLYFPSSL